MGEIRNLFRTNEFSLCEEDIARENRLAIRMLAVSGLPLSVANIFAQTFLSRRELMSMRTLWLPLYFAALYLIERLLIPKDCRKSTLLLYLLTAPPLIVAILLGTVWDPSHQALTFLMFLIAMPVFIFDNPRRLLGVTLGWCVVFLALCMAVKDPFTHRGDFFHTLEFFFSSATVVLITLRVRLESLRNFERTRYYLEHDNLTGLRSRHSLEKRMDSYLGRPVMVILGDLDQMMLYNDFYGSRTRDQMLSRFAQRLRDQFGEKHTYRYGGDEILCIACDASEDEVLDRLAQCRENLRRNNYNGHTLSLTCSFGYAYGTPSTVQELQDIIQLANIYTHNAHRQGQGYTVGGPYDAQHLRSAITQSVIVAHAREWEENNLSGLLTLNAFLTGVQTLLDSDLEMPSRSVIGFFHIIHFRHFNEEFGYAKGDALIRYTSKLLQQGFPGRYICNVSGSQFGFMCYEDEVEAGLKLVNDNLKNYQQDYTIVSKCGFVFAAPGESVLSLLDKAKAAQATILRHPSIDYRYYDDSMDEDTHFEQYLVSHVDQAISKGWIKVYYQPIVRAVSGEICNEEALSRWDDPTYGFLSPVQFIPALEESHQLYKVTLQVVRQVLEDFRTKEQRGLTPVPVSINFSRHDFEEHDMVRAVTEMIDQAGYSHDMIRVEITESAFMENQELLKREINRFRDSGFQVWMDDFGSEYSTLNLLQQLEFDLIKVDMEFMRNFSVAGKNRIIVSNVISMAQKMGISTLVEGVETEEHYRFLRQLGCEKLQGYLFSKPSSLDYLLEWTTSDGAIQYESKEDAAYYEAIGGVDLNGADLPEAAREFIHAAGGMAAGVLEYRGHSLTCLRDGEAFYPMLRELDLLSVSRMGTQRKTLKDPVPAALVDAAGRCLETTDWIACELSTEHGARVTARLRQLSQNHENGSTALLILLIPVEAS